MKMGDRKWVNGLVASDGFANATMTAYLLYEQCGAVEPESWRNNVKSKFPP